jgi:hypothetical protein
LPLYILHYTTARGVSPTYLGLRFPLFLFAWLLLLLLLRRLRNLLFFGLWCHYRLHVIALPLQICPWNLLLLCARARPTRLCCSRSDRRPAAICILSFIFLQVSIPAGSRCWGLMVARLSAV